MKVSWEAETSIENRDAVDPLLKSQQALQVLVDSYRNDEHCC
jgi:hypothetical protein